MRNPTILCTLCLVAVLALGGLLLPAPARAEPPRDLVDQVAALHLGMGGYVLAVPLTPEQKKEADKARLESSYQGTYSFRSGDFKVVADKATDLVLALYMEEDEADLPAYRKMVATLMDRFGDPTTMAHDQIIYWAWGPKGRIGEEEFKKARDEGKLEVLATVKFNSEASLAAMTQDPEGKKVRIYAILTSGPLLEHYVKK